MLMSVDAVRRKVPVIQRHSLAVSSPSLAPISLFVSHQTLSFLASFLSFLLVSFHSRSHVLSFSLLTFLEAQFVLCVNVCSDMAIKWRLNLETLEYWAVIEAVSSLIVLRVATAIVRNYLLTRESLI